MAMNNGGPAFPCEQHETQDNLWNQTFESGMTLRDYFAAKALPAYLSHVSDGGSAILSRCYAEAAKEAYEIADAMIKARDEQEKQA